MTVRIVALSQSRCMARSVQGNRAWALEAVGKALEAGPDLVCLPEAFTARGVPTRSVADVAETVPGPTTDAFAELARRQRCYVVCALYTSRDGLFWNSAVVIGRDGSIVGIYDKMRPCSPPGANDVFEEGVCPGRGPGVFDLDIGRVGIRICMDVNFPDDWTAMAEHGVKAVLWPSASDGGIALQAHAVLNHYYVVSSVRSGRARVSNPCGHVVAATAPGDHCLVSDISLDFAVARQDFNPSLAERIAAAHGARVVVHTYGDEGLYLIEPVGDGVTTQQLQADFGFELAAQTIERHRRAYARVQRRGMLEAVSGSI